MATDNIWPIIHLSTAILYNVFIWVSLNMFTRSPTGNTNDVLLIFLVSLHECYTGIKLNEIMFNEIL